LTKWLHAKECQEIRRIILSEIAALQARAINARVDSTEKPNMEADYELSMKRLSVLMNFIAVLEELLKNGGVFHSYDVNVGYGI